MKICLWLFSAIVVLISCDTENKDNFDKIESYPTNVGTEWSYSSESIIKIYESEAFQKVIDTDTFSLSIKVKIEKDTVLNDTMFVKQFTSRADGADFISKEYFFVDTDGLKAYAYSNPTLHVFAKKYNLMYELLNQFTPQFHEPINPGENDFYVYEPSPRLNLKFPLELNSKWTYTIPYEPLNLQIDKEIVGYEVIKLNNHSYSCYIISWIYLENKFFDETKIYDWISNEGLIKRQITYKKTVFSVPPDETIGYGQVTETIILKELKLK
jgi:hypothetical protein